MKSQIIQVIRTVSTEFKEFAVRGNVIDIAIGMLIGSGVAPIATSLINDIVMPPIGYLLGNADLSNLFITIKTGSPGGPYSSLLNAKEAGAVTINCGKFLNTILSFLVVAWAAFGIVKLANKVERKFSSDLEKNIPPKLKLCKYCQSKVPIKAIKCLHCTSDIEDILHSYSKTS